MKGFIQLTKLKDVSGNYSPSYKIDGPVCINVKGIESYTDHRVITLSGNKWIVQEKFQDISNLIEEATKEE